MADDDEVSAGGSRIHRHAAPDGDFVPAADPRYVEEIEEHFARHVGAAETVLHEIVSHHVHVDVHVIAPTDERPLWTLFTTAMSDLPMKTPDEAKDHAFAELVLTLPRDWRVDLSQVTPPPPDLDRWYWPIGWLKFLARFPHQFGTWLGHGHSVPNGDPPKPFAPGTDLCGWLLLPSLTLPEDAWQLTTNDGATIRFFGLYALYAQELELKLEKGTDALVDAFERAEIDDVLVPDRKPAVRRKWLGVI